MRKKENPNKITNRNPFKPKRVQSDECTNQKKIFFSKKESNKPDQEINKLRMKEITNFVYLYL